MPVSVVLLSLCQALLVSGNILLIAVSPLIGAQLAPGPNWATAPVATQLLGLMSATIPASLIMARLGRKLGFVLGNLVGLAGVAVAALALVHQRFGMFMLGTALIGVGIGFGMLYRFAAAEAAPPAGRDRAIGLVMGGGVMAAFLGPWLARASRDLLATPFLGSFIGLGALYLLALMLLLFTHLPAPSRSHGDGPARPLGEILRQPVFVVAAVSGLVGYGVMNLAMTATPLAMQRAGFAFDPIATTIQWHVLAMFLPSFVTGRLTARLGAPTMIATGCLLLIGCALIAQLDLGLGGYYTALILLGLGWNATFLPATGLLTEAHRPPEKARTQAANECLVFTTVSVSALLAAPLEASLGWAGLNALLIPFALLPLLALTWQRLVSAADRPQIRG
ncbi:MFS transporter [Modicisalibacter coralii]|uniref:MFS transporter n=1 Tax=Modicisalibacter coralii TaxID=2304602 RepID=UPI00100AF58A|nr:MFS transporter [Halomonas coralii]